MGRLSGCITNMCGNQCKLICMLGLTGSFMLVELIVGNTTNSMALVADSFHMLSDVIAIIIAFISVRMSPKRWKKNTFGWARAEVVGALVNAVFLFALCFSIFVEAIKRFMVIEPLKDPVLILIVGGTGLVINVIGLFLFGHHGHSHDDEDDGDDQLHDGEHDHGHGHDKESGDKQKPSKKHGHSHGGGASGEQMNIAGVFLHIMADALGSVVVMISASVIWLTDWEYRDYLDPVLSLVIVILICISSWPLLRDSTLILLNSIPGHIDMAKLQEGLATQAQVVSVHELHIWRLVGSRLVATCHLEVSQPVGGVTNVEHHMNTARIIKEYFHSQGIHSTTIQLEYTDTNNMDDDCQVKCPLSKGVLGLSGVASSCVDNSCCRNRIKSQNNPAIDVKTQF